MTHHAGHHDDDANARELKDQFWKEMVKSSYVMLSLDVDPDTAAPMTAQLDKDANSAIWFFTTRDNRFAELGAATATYTSKGHDLFARFAGELVEETDRALIDHFWSNPVQAWFPKGKDDPNLLLMRMDLGDASIWGAELGVSGVVRMMLGIDVRDKARDKAETQL